MWIPGVVRVPLIFPNLLVVNSAAVVASVGAVVSVMTDSVVTKVKKSQKKNKETKQRNLFFLKDRPSERPRLNLKPRSVDHPSENVASPTPKANRPDPFGGAKPVDTNKALKDLENKFGETSINKE